MENFKIINGQSKLGESLYKSSYMSDVRFEVDGSVINAHKFILSFQSEMFYTMFYGSMELKDDCIPITHIGKEAFEKILWNIYTGEIDFTDMDTYLLIEILYGAKMYMLNDLNDKCIRDMNSKTYNPERALELYLVSEIYPEIDIDNCLDRLTSCCRLVFDSNYFLNSSVHLIQKYIALLDDKECVPKQIIFEFLLKWAKNQCDNNQIPETSPNMVSVLSKNWFTPLPYYIARFSTLDIIELVRERHLLEDSELIEIIIRKMSFSSSLDANPIKVYPSCYYAVKESNFQIEPLDNFCPQIYVVGFSMDSAFSGLATITVERDAATVFKYEKRVDQLKEHVPEIGVYRTYLYVLALNDENSSRIEIKWDPLTDRIVVTSSDLCNISQILYM